MAGKKKVQWKNLGNKLKIDYINISVCVIISLSVNI